jgi:hypothetical protein
MEAEGSLLCSQRLATSPWPEPHDFSSRNPILFLRPIYATVCHMISFLQVFTKKNLFAFLFCPMYSACLIYVILLDLITLTILYKEYQLQS